MDVLLKRGSLGQSVPTVRWMVGVAFDMHNLRGDILGTISDRVDDVPQPTAQ